MNRKPPFTLADHIEARAWVAIQARRQGVDKWGRLFDWLDRKIDELSDREARIDAAIKAAEHTDRTAA